jgi:ABC-type transport system involved in cytochrome bd biosynthesis fused ATPase/permease subunit
MAMKLPHWAQVTLGLAVVVVTWVVQQQSAGNLTLPAAAVTVLTTLNTFMGLVSPSVRGAA